MSIKYAAKKTGNEQNGGQLNLHKIPNQQTTKFIGKNLAAKWDDSNEGPKFLKYFFRDCVKNSEKMSKIVEEQKKQVQQADNDTPQGGEGEQLKNCNNNLGGKLSQQQKQQQHSSLLDFSKIAEQTFSGPLVPQIPQNFTAKTAALDYAKLSDCLQELKPVTIVINASGGKKKINGNDTQISESEAVGQIKKHALEGQKALVQLEYRSALLNLKKSEIIMHAYVAKEGKIERDLLLFVKANLGICYYRIGLLAEAFHCFAVCLAHLKKQYKTQKKVVAPLSAQTQNGFTSMRESKGSSSTNFQQQQSSTASSSSSVIWSQYKKRSYSNLPTIDQQEYMQMLAQRLKLKRLKGALLLQTCIVLSEQGNHEDALILGNKASRLHLNYIVDTLTVCYHLILQIIKERDITINTASSGLRAQTSRRGNSAHQSGTNQLSPSNNNTNNNRKKSTGVSQSTGAPYNLFEGDFVQELVSPQPANSQFLMISGQKEKISFIEKVVPILKEVMKRTQDLHGCFISSSKMKILETLNKIIDNSNKNTSKITSPEAGDQTSSIEVGTAQVSQLEVSLYERPDLEFLFQTITSRNHWIFKANILNLLQLKSVSFEDASISNAQIESEILLDSLLSKISHLCVSFYCISTESRFIADSKKNKAKEQQQQQKAKEDTTPTTASNADQDSKYARFLQNLNYQVSESENWLSRSVEIAYIFLPHDMPLVGQIVSVHSKFHNVNKIVIPENENEHDSDSDSECSSNATPKLKGDKQHKQTLYKSLEYASPLVNLPGRSKSSFFIPLVRKIKPDQLPLTQRSSSSKPQAEEEIALLYNTYSEKTQTDGNNSDNLSKSAFEEAQQKLKDRLLVQESSPNQPAIQAQTIKRDQQDPELLQKQTNQKQKKKISLAITDLASTGSVKHLKPSSVEASGIVIPKTCHNFELNSLSKTADSVMQVDKKRQQPAQVNSSRGRMDEKIERTIQLQDECNQEEQEDDQYSEEEDFQIRDINPQIFIANKQQMSAQPLKNDRQQMIVNKNKNVPEKSSLLDKNQPIGMQQQSEASRLKYQQYPQPDKQRHNSLDYALKQNSNNNGIGQDLQLGIVLQNSSKSFSAAFPNQNNIQFVVPSSSSSSQPQQNSQTKKKRVMSLAQEQQSSIQTSLLSPSTHQELYTDRQTQQSKLKKLLSKQLTTSIQHRTIDNPSTAAKQQLSQKQNGHFKNTIDMALNDMSMPNSSKNSTSNSAAVTARQQYVQQGNTVINMSDTFEIRRKSSTGNVSSTAKTQRSGSLTKNQKANPQTNVKQPLTNMSMQQQQAALKNNFIQQQILNEIFDVNNQSLPTHKQSSKIHQRGNSAHGPFTNQQNQSFTPSSATSASSSSSFHFSGNNFSGQSDAQASPSIATQQQLINHLTNSKRPHSKENIQRSFSAKNPSSQSEQTTQGSSAPRKNKKNLDILVNQQIVFLNASNQHCVESVGAKSSRSSKNSASFLLPDNYLNLIKSGGNQSTRLAQNSSGNNYLNQSGSLTAKNSVTISMLNSPTGSFTIQAPQTTRNHTPKQNESSQYQSTNEKKLHLLRKFRSSVGKVPEDLFQRK